MTKSNAYRFLFYCTGLLILAMGLTLNTKAGLGVSPIISVSYSVSEIFDHNFGNMTLLLYTSFVVIEMTIHLLRGLRQKTPSLGIVLLLDFLQIPLSLVFTRFLNVFAGLIPDLASSGMNSHAEMALRVIVLLCAILCTGIGAAMSLNMRLVPNPGDGIVQTLADSLNKKVGLTKNCFDLTNIAITCTLSLLCTGHIVGIGFGTLLAMIGVGRTIAVFNHLTENKLRAIAEH